MARHPHAHDIPGSITLTGNNIWSSDPVIPYPTHIDWRVDGTEPELLAWGIRNPYGLAFSEEGELYASDNDYEEKGNRAVGEILIDMAYQERFEATWNDRYAGLVRLSRLRR